MKDASVVTAVEEHYAAVARGEASPCGAPVDDVARSIGYSDEELALAGDANLGLGCGNPLALTEIAPGMTVLDLGAGAGFDAFLALSRVGPTGRVIGVDMTDDMLALARANAEKRGAANVEFRKGFIEQLPVEDHSVDYVISNCVINLSADKPVSLSRDRPRAETGRPIRRQRHRAAQASAVRVGARHRRLCRLHLRRQSAYRLPRLCLGGRSSRSQHPAHRPRSRPGESAGAGRLHYWRKLLLRLDGIHYFAEEPGHDGARSRGCGSIDKAARPQVAGH